MTRFSDFNEALLANAKRVDTKRKEDDILDKLASQLVVLKERQQIKQQIDYAFNRRTAEIAQERRIKKGIDERSQKRKQEKLEDEKDRGQANGALSNYKLRKGNLINLLDGIESAAVDAINRDPRNLDPYIKVMQEMEEPATTLSDMFRILEKNGLNVLVDEVLEEHEMSPKALKYFMGWVEFFRHPRPRKDADDIRDKNFVERRSDARLKDGIVEGFHNIFMGGALVHPGWGQGNQDATIFLPPKLMTETVPVMQQQSDQNLQMSYQLQIAYLQANQSGPDGGSGAC